MFLLEKWYMDVVTTDGQVAIGYFATLKWKKLAFTYSGFIQRESDGNVVIKNSLKKAPAPLMFEKKLSWDSIFFKGAWEVIDSPIQLDLLKNKDQFIDWNCLMPKGVGRVVFGDTCVEGFGYAEKMTLNIFPWQLPIKELFWGRFLSKDYSIIWIEWRGTQPKTFLIVNGKIRTSATISNESVQTPDLLIAFESKHPLRSGKIGKTIFKSFRQILSIFPTTIFQLDENKWCGVANLTIDNQQCNGTYIHEQVIWH